MTNNILAGVVGSENNPEITNPVLGPIGNLTGIGYFQKLIPSLVGLAFVIGSVIFVFVLIIGAVQWISSGGDKGNLESARAKISSALIGIVILLSSLAIIKLIEFFFKIDILTIDIGPLIIQ